MMHCFPGPKTQQMSSHPLRHRKGPMNASIVTCMLVRVLETPLALGAVSLLQEEGSSFHHEKALTQAGKNKAKTQLEQTWRNTTARRMPRQREDLEWTDDGPHAMG